MNYSLLRSLLFQLNPEAAHAVTLNFLRHIYRPWMQPAFLKNLPQHPINLLGLNFPNPLGLAAGLDKNGECIDAWLSMGFGFVEVGTVTPKPQHGNPKPRLFRIPQAQALINRMGFNNKGVDYLISRLKARKVPGIVGVNIGKNLTTPIEQAVNDYKICLQKVYAYADYIVVNISSPNTPGLRELQQTDYLNHLLSILKKLQKNLQNQYQKYVPLIIKTESDLTAEQVNNFVACVIEHQVDGIITSNTSVDHQPVAHLPHGQEAGGLSGAPIHERAVGMVKQLHDLTQAKIPIIGVGGIGSANKAQNFFVAGASLVQIYTGFIYHGPPLIAKILNSLPKV